MASVLSERVGIPRLVRQLLEQLAGRSGLPELRERAGLEDAGHVDIVLSRPLPRVAPEAGIQVSGTVGSKVFLDRERCLEHDLRLDPEVEQAAERREHAFPPADHVHRGSEEPPGHVGFERRMRRFRGDGRGAPHGPGARRIAGDRSERTPRHDRVAAVYPRAASPEIRRLQPLGDEARHVDRAIRIPEPGHVEVDGQVPVPRIVRQHAPVGCRLESFQPAVRVFFPAEQSEVVSRREPVQDWCRDVRIAFGLGRERVERGPDRIPHDLASIALLPFGERDAERIRGVEQDLVRRPHRPRLGEDRSVRVQLSEVLGRVLCFVVDDGPVRRAA